MTSYLSTAYSGLSSIITKTASTWWDHKASTAITATALTAAGLLGYHFFRPDTSIASQARSYLTADAKGRKEWWDRRQKGYERSLTQESKLSEQQRRELSLAWVLNETRAQMIANFAKGDKETHDGVVQRLWEVKETETYDRVRTEVQSIREKLREEREGRTQH